MRDLTKKLQLELQEQGFLLSYSSSNTDFGHSEYIMVRDNFTDEPLKIRISDHSVTNFDRVFLEIHINHTMDFENAKTLVLDKVNFHFRTSIFFDKIEEISTLEKTFEIPAHQLLSADEVLESFLSKKKNQMFKIRRNEEVKTIKYIKKDTGDIYLTRTK